MENLVRFLVSNSSVVSGWAKRVAGAIGVRDEGVKGWSGGSCVVEDRRSLRARRIERIITRKIPIKIFWFLESIINYFTGAGAGAGTGVLAGAACPA